ncbi:transglutaminase domain-containing protein [Rasiella sp. SM2506]|uniref:transglutaminase domain-containing protein n=1 Tax=Rasiella sp. SM2506 TaxID=3423914 RepID=UPI003D7A4B5B
MNRIGILIVLYFFSTGTISAQIDTAQIDATIQFYPTNFNTVAELSNLISRDFTSEEAKVRAIYGWIINNVAYEPNEYKVFNYSFKNYRERNIKEENTRDKIIERTLQKGIAVCEGYAMLFEKLCELQGIQNYLVRGDIKTNFEDIGRAFKRVHMWNVVYLEGKPHLIDATWGAGKYKQKFIKEPSYYWYKTDSKHFIKTHYPDLVEDAFLDVTFRKEAFANLPIIIKKELLIEDVKKPESGVIHSVENEKEITFLLKTDAPKTLSYSYNFGAKEKIKNSISKDGFLEFQIKTKAGSNLVVYFDDEPALAYKVE